MARTATTKRQEPAGAVVSEQGQEQALATLSPDLAALVPDGERVTAFLARLVPFFQEAQRLERQASGTLAEMRALPMPTNGQEDADVQRQIKAANQFKHGIEEHWAPMKVFYALYKRLVVERDRPIKMLGEVAEIGNGHHNRYVQAEQRRARDEQERLDREATERAERDRETALRTMEEEALKLEAGSADLSLREDAFVARFTDGMRGEKGNGPRCAELAGFKDAIKASAKLLAMAKIQAAIQARESANLIRSQAEAVRQMPVAVEAETVRPDITRAAGAVDRSTWSAELTDEDALIEAIMAGKLGIPRDLLEINRVRLNQYARDLHELLDRWPGCRSKRTTRVV